MKQGFRKVKREDIAYSREEKKKKLRVKKLKPKPAGNICPNCQIVNDFFCHDKPHIRNWKWERQPTTGSASGATTMSSIRGSTA
jgi:hypothetical protein